MRRGSVLAGGLLLLPSLAAIFALSPRPVLADEDTTTTITAAGETAYSIPAGAYALQVTVVGSTGGTAASSGAPGQGALVQATIPVPDGLSTLYVEVGNSSGAGGGGASAGGGAGGGASDVQTCSVAEPGCAYTADPASDPRLVVAGGGGGGGQNDPNFDFIDGGAGGSAGASGTAVTGPGGGGGYGEFDDPFDGAPGGDAGLGADASTAAPGAGCPGNGTGTAGSPGTGGAGQELPGVDWLEFAAGGSGGGGWVGGSGGGSGGCYYPSLPGFAVGSGGGGGAGASFLESSATDTSVTTAGDTPAEAVITPLFAIAPLVISAASTTFTVGSGGAFTVTTSGAPTASLSDGSATLPSGVTFTDNGDGTATLAGTPVAGSAGTYDFTITANNGFSLEATQDFTLTVDNPASPAITSDDDTSFTTGTSDSFTVTTSGAPTPTLRDGDATLPSGVTFTDDGDGTATIAGTPAPGSGGIYELTVTAGNGVSPDATQGFSLTVDEAPAITSAETTTFAFGVYESFTVTTSGYPTSSLSSSGLPGWITFTDNGNGTATISGTVLGTGISDVVITASNGISPDATQDFTFYGAAAPAFTSVPFAGFVVSRSNSFTVTTQGVPAASLSDGGAILPSGVSFTDNGDGSATLAGTPAAGSGGTYAITITADNGVSPDGVQDFTLTVGEAAAPAITSNDGATFTVGGADSFTVTATGLPFPSISEVGDLPEGVTFTDEGEGTATLEGTPAAGTGGTYSFTIGASNGVSPDAAQDFTLTVDAASTLVSLTSSADPSVVGETLTLTASVAIDPSGLVTPTGTVAFFEGSTLADVDTPISGCTAQPVAEDGTATCTLSFAAVADPYIGATYPGNDSFVGSSSGEIAQEVDQAATTVTVTSSPKPATAGQAVTITVTVEAVAPGAGNPTGQVTVYVDGTGFATLTLDSSMDSQAVLSTDALAAGNRSITASYSGDANYAASATSSADPLRVTSEPAVPTTGVAAQTIGIVPGILLILAGLSLLGWRRRAVS
ncbi:MAG: Ig-like domain repeat protein [Candidatus Dormiibacterota bacterium]